MVVALAEKMANAALYAMRDPRRAIADKLTSQDGVNAVGVSEAVHEATKGAHTMNDHVESNFGGFDNVCRMFRYATVAHIGGIAQQMRNGDFERAENLNSVKRTRKDSEEKSAGFFHAGLTDELRESLVELARHEAPKARADGRAATVAHDQHKLAHREERVISMLNAAVEHYAYALELFKAWEAQRAKSSKEVNSALEARKSEAEKLEFLRKQIEMRVLGLGWTQFATRWSSQADEKIGTAAHLTALLNEIIVEETALARLKKLPTEAAPPHHQARELKTLGTVDTDALEIEAKALFSADELRAKAEKAMLRRLGDGTSDAVENLQPLTPPAFDQSLVGKKLEVLWKYIDKATKDPMLIWITGRVARVADGLSDKRSSRARKILPGGALLWAWDADPDFDERAGEQWLILLPDKWNKQVHYGWRFDPSELTSATPADAPIQPAKRARKQAPVVYDSSDDEECASSDEEECDSSDEE
jgi:superoxide dismutase